MSTPSSSPPRRTPLGPYSNRQDASANSKPAPGKENIRPLPASSIASGRATSLGPQPSAAATTEASPSHTTPSTRNASVTATAIQQTATAADILGEPETATSVALPASIPPWRLPGAFDDSGEEQETTVTENANEEKDTSLVNGAEDNGSGESGEYSREEVAATTSIQGNDALPASQSVDDASGNEDLEQDWSSALYFAAIGITSRFLPAVVVDLDADPMLDYGDEFHELV